MADPRRPCRPPPDARRLVSTGITRRLMRRVVLGTVPPTTDMQNGNPPNLGRTERWGPDFFLWLAVPTLGCGCVVGPYETCLIPLSLAFSLSGLAIGALRWRRLTRWQVASLGGLAVMAAVTGWWYVQVTLGRPSVRGLSSPVTGKPPGCCEVMRPEKSGSTVALLENPASRAVQYRSEPGVPERPVPPT